MTWSGRNLSRSVLIPLALMGSLSHAAEGTVSLDVSSAYVFRGVTLTDGWVAQPGMEIGSFHGFTFGLWGNMPLEETSDGMEKYQFSEIDLYVSYKIPIEALDVSVGVTEYTYPGADTSSDREASLSIRRSLAGIEVGLDCYYGLDGAVQEDLYFELSANYAHELGREFVLEVGSTLGYRTSKQTPDGFPAYTLNAKVSRGIWGAGLTYIGRLDEDVLSDADYNAQVVGTLSLALEF